MNTRDHIDGFLGSLNDYMNQFYPPLEDALEGTTVYDKTHKYPVFVILTHSGASPLSKGINLFTGSEYSHSSISFNQYLTPMYSFGQKKLGGKEIGFVVNNYKSDYLLKYPTKYILYVAFVTRKQINQMQKRLDYFIKNEKTMKYDWIGLGAYVLNIKREVDIKYFCSRFVATILGETGQLSRNASLYSPEDLKMVPFIEEVNRGKDLYHYDFKVTEKNMEKIMNRGKN